MGSKFSHCQKEHPTVIFLNEKDRPQECCILKNCKLCVVVPLVLVLIAVMALYYYEYDYSSICTSISQNIVEFNLLEPKVVMCVCGLFAFIYIAFTCLRAKTVFSKSSLKSKESDLDKLVKMKLDDKDIKYVAQGVKIDIRNKVETPLKSKPVQRLSATQHKSDDEDDYVSLDMIKSSYVDSGKKLL